MPEQSHEQAVRFASVNQEIEPAYSLQSVDTLAPDEQRALSPEAHAEIRNLSRTLQESHLQHRRMSHFAFEPVSLPVSRVGHTHIYIPALRSLPQNYTYPILLFFASTFWGFLHTSHIYHDPARHAIICGLARLGDKIR